MSDTIEKRKKLRAIYDEAVNLCDGAWLIVKENFGSKIANQQLAQNAFRNAYQRKFDAYMAIFAFEGAV